MPFDIFLDHRFSSNVIGNGALMMRAFTANDEGDADIDRWCGTDRARPLDSLEFSDLKKSLS
jgi:hypothetical protein